MQNLPREVILSCLRRETERRLGRTLVPAERRALPDSTLRAYPLVDPHSISADIPGEINTASQAVDEAAESTTNTVSHSNTLPEPVSLGTLSAVPLSPSSGPHGVRSRERSGGIIDWESDRQYYARSTLPQATRPNSALAALSRMILGGGKMEFTKDAEVEGEDGDGGGSSGKYGLDCEAKHRAGRASEGRVGCRKENAWMKLT